MIKRIAQAWGFASILLLPNYIDLTSAAGDERMRSPFPLTPVALAHLADLFIVAFVFALLMAALRKFKIWPALRWFLLALLPPFLLLRNLNVFPFTVPDFAVLAASLLWIALLAFLIFLVPAVATRIRLVGSAVLTGFAVFALVISAQLVRAALWRPGPQSFAAPIPTASPSKPRLVWILFDELAYKPVFESRDPSLNLPNFDRLRTQSTLYGQIQPIAYWTTQVVPSLFLGQIVTSVTYTDDNRYLIKTEDSPHWHKFDVNDTLIGLAKQRGITTSITGWCITYCPVFADTATECYWSNDDAQDRGPTSLSSTFAQNVGFPLRILAEQFLAPAKAWSDTADFKSRGHILSVQDVSRHALRTLQSSQADFIYIHLPSPHPPEFWNRHTQSFAPGGSYLDSLAFSDQMLGKILDQLASQPRWAATTLVVQGDHSWRTKMWRPLPGWSAEDERASHGGQWDPRPMLLIHAAGQQHAETVAVPTSLMFVHDFVAAQLRNLAP
jgi:hypothetical protein